MTFTCSYDGFFIDDQDVNFMVILKKHERWHTNCRVEKRNNTEGVVTWVVD